MKIKTSDTFDRGGLRFRAHIEQDDSGDAPWERSDGHGPVRCVSAHHRRPDKRPGERVLHDSRGTCWLYDWQAACAMARRDGWNAEPYDAPGRIERAVKADFDFLRSWLQNDWCYVGVCVVLLNADGDPLTGRCDNALWGIESCCHDYIEKIANELADQILAPRRAAWRSALTSARATTNLKRLAVVQAAVLR